MKVIGIIPARYGSSRFEGKPLADICGKTMIQRVYEQAIQAIDVVYVATDDQRIYDRVISFGGKAIMTSIEHQTGSNRCLEASNSIQAEYNHDVIINIQGDEPLLDPENLKTLIDLFRELNVNFGTLIKRTESNELITNDSGVYVVKNQQNEAIYFSRSIVPFVRDHHKDSWGEKHTFYKHIGVYGYTVSALSKFAALNKSTLEIAENLEQLRWLEHGGTIKLAEVEDNGISVDTQDDLEKVINYLRR